MLKTSNLYIGCPYKVLDLKRRIVPQMGVIAVMWPILNFGPPIITLEQPEPQSSFCTHAGRITLVVLGWQSAP